MTRRPRLWLLVLPPLLWGVIFFAFCRVAHAQTGGFVFSERESGQPHGLYQRGWNTTAVEIPAGTLVQADTAGSGTVPQIVMGKGFKTWTGATADFNKIMGVLIDPSPAGHGWARVMVKGFLPNAKVMGSPAAGGYLRPSFTAVGRMTAWALADSEAFYTSKWCAVFQRYARTDSAIAYVWVDFSDK